MYTNAYVGVKQLRIASFCAETAGLKCFDSSDICCYK